MRRDAGSQKWEDRSSFWINHIALHGRKKPQRGLLYLAPGIYSRGIKWHDNPSPGGGEQFKLINKYPCIQAQIHLITFLIHL
jgi:hypothetical protein